MNKSQLLEELKRAGIKQEILEAIDKIDRKKFIPSQLASQAYEDYPLPIGYNQTISQPYTVAFMLQKLELEKGDKVLEIGTGSGWNAALIGYLTGKKGKVYSFEIIKELAKTAKEKLKNCKNIKVIQGNALNLGKKHAPYDRIIITAAPESMEKLEIFKQQLSENGILMAPIGRYSQQMIKITKHKGKFTQQNLGDFVFVPLVEDEAWKPL